MEIWIFRRWVEVWWVGLVGDWWGMVVWRSRRGLGHGGCRIGRRGVGYGGLDRSGEGWGMVVWIGRRGVGYGGLDRQERGGVWWL